MQACSDALAGTPSFDLRLTHREDGLYEVSCPAYPEIPAVADADQGTAVERFRQGLEAFVLSGFQLPLSRPYQP